MPRLPQEDGLELGHTLPLHERLGTGCECSSRTSAHTSLLHNVCSAHATPTTVHRTHAPQTLPSSQCDRMQMLRLFTATLTLQTCNAHATDTPSDAHTSGAMHGQVVVPCADVLGLRDNCRIEAVLR